MTHATPPKTDAAGSDRLLYGMILGVLAFWLFAQTTLNIAPTMAADLGVPMNVMNIAVSITALFSGIFIVVMGGLADRAGRVQVVQWGFVLSIAGSLLVGIAPRGALAPAVLIAGRICQGLSGACIMPASLALVKAYWSGAARQRAVSLWSMGSWGGSGFAALFGGLMAQNVGWRWIFFAGAARLGGRHADGARYAREPRRGQAGLPVRCDRGRDVHGHHGRTRGARDAGGEVRLDECRLALPAGVIAVVVGFLFFRTESRSTNAFVDFRLFRNATYTGATLSNLLLNAVVGIMIVSMTLLQLGGRMSAQDAGLLTLGYAIAIVAFIRVGEKLLQRFGPRRPMLWGSLIVGVSIVLLMPTFVMLPTYRVLAVIAFTLFGLGLAFYATPSTDAAIANLPDAEAGSGSGIYKMASSLGASFGVAISAAIFTALSADDAASSWVAGAFTFVGRQDNVALREAALVAFGANLVMVVAAIVAIVVTIPKRRVTDEPREAAAR